MPNNLNIDKKDNVKILMTLTTPACPMVSFLVKEVHDVVKSLKGVGDVDVELTFDPPWQAPKKIKEMFKM